MEQAAKAGEYDYNGFVEAIRRSPMNDADKKIAQEKTLTCLLAVNVRRRSLNRLTTITTTAKHH